MTRICLPDSAAIRPWIGPRAAVEAAMTSAAAPLTDDLRARRNVRVLVFAQAILGSQMPISFVLGGLAGQLLAPNKCLATLPISVIVFGSMLSAPFLSNLMQARGRTVGFVIGAARSEERRGGKECRSGGAP